MLETAEDRSTVLVMFSASTWLSRTCNFRSIPWATTRLEQPWNSPVLGRTREWRGRSLRCPFRSDSIELMAIRIEKGGHGNVESTAGS